MEEVDVVPAELPKYLSRHPVQLVVGRPQALSGQDPSKVGNDGVVRASVPGGKGVRQPVGDLIEDASRQHAPKDLDRLELPVLFFHGLAGGYLRPSPAVNSLAACSPRAGAADAMLLAKPVSMSYVRDNGAHASDSKTRVTRESVRRCES